MPAHSKNPQLVAAADSGSDHEILEFVCDTAVGQAPLDEAELSILEIRTLGGGALSGTKLPSGNCHHTFFADLITLYDAGKKTAGERQAIADLTRRLVEKARNVDNLTVDFSGTHSQPDDADYMVSAPDIFGTEAMAENVKALKRKRTGTTGSDFTRLRNSSPSQTPTPES
jgi:hypothetical protein